MRLLTYGNSVHMSVADWKFHDRDDTASPAAARRVRQAARKTACVSSKQVQSYKEIGYRAGRLVYSPKKFDAARAMRCVHI